MPRWIGQLAYGYDPQNAPLTEEEPMNVYRYLVTVQAETKEDADIVMGQRLGGDDEYGFDYVVTYEDDV